ncbi:hypothetical protein AMATHDRAFT_141947 [Amanita thiersii Skay4041]|uniref:Mitochondrial distribution and morphology protein 12 n=1 Tax=Amanita thiersii Skay4041 TaxID=703135 RepID=A0A2A9NVK7_9AGAR|nr:hypothetical protein AMATHDRAFT_141947 [Amanita thiersii Skay4041]
MSIDLEWNRLDPSLASYLVDVLNRQLSNVERPSFIGPVEITSLDLGSVPPDVELVDLRDIYRDFLEDDDDDPDKDPMKAGDEDEGFEWVSRRAGAVAASDMERDELRQRLAFQHLPPHVRYSYGFGRPMDMFSSMPTLHSPADSWAATTGPGMGIGGGMSRSVSAIGEMQYASNAPQPSDQRQYPNPHPNLQLHLHVNWHSNMRITLTTSLLINYPSPMFMSLPIKLSVTGVVFNGELAVAYEGERRRVHICILDDMDPYGPTGDRKRHSTSSTPPDIDEESPVSGIPPRSSKPLRVGQRLLPSIYIESEIGQADKHVLKNVTRVERFIQDVIRKTLEEELVFPNFHTIILGES